MKLITLVILCFLHSCQSATLDSNCQIVKSAYAARGLNVGDVPNVPKIGKEFWVLSKCVDKLTKVCLFQQVERM